jgi:hypothetical protein
VGVDTIAAEFNGHLSFEVLLENCEVKAVGELHLGVRKQLRL